MDQLIKLLSSFDTISLKEIDSFKSMNRTDTKFAFNEAFLPELLDLIKPYYNCLQIESKQIANYQTLYYDTSDLMLYYKHHNGSLNRYKVRQRNYLDSKLCFLEVKFKNNKGRTIKERIEQNDLSTNFNFEDFEFLNKKLPFNPNILFPTVLVNYKRITLVNKFKDERLTIDVNIEFKKDNELIKLHNLVVAEVKQDKKVVSPFLKQIKKLHFIEGSISKYCLAIIFSYKNVKKNNFKEKLLSLKSILTHDSITNIFETNFYSRNN